MRTGRDATAAALGVILLLAGCGDEREQEREEPWDSGVSADSGADEACAATRAVLQGLDNWIAFDSNRNDQNRDIYIIRPDGEDLRRLTTDESVERSPKFSPDGQQIVFVSDRSGESALYLLHLATKEQSGPISSGGAEFPDWSPDGERIAFILAGALYDVKPDGSDERLLLDMASSYGFNMKHPTYSADGQYIFWDLSMWIGRCNADGSDPRELFPPGNRTADAPSPAPNGMNVALRTFCDSEDPTVPLENSAIYMIPWNGYVGPWEAQDVCKLGVRVTPASEAYALNPSWGPGFIAFESGQWNRTIKVIEPVAARACEITVGPFDDRNPAWSPEGFDAPLSL
jgi:Tol biopolymer transport system component